ncbi:uncharacterized protein LOC129914452 isoform X1 [Episyrphus balteatus]|uniref:uncharacterized protein LOC129914452 isoform X1 n=1 Tax=Episyrphus balteatus TaxID=286459 RepID=UPI002486A5B6|nr:uncharacterized protein LOC129914452 isoform X1 [Episyrphus balteatus]
MNTKQAAKFDGIDDLRTNVKFLELIKKYECLWKHDSPNYRKKSVKHKAWKEIAKVCKNSVLRCRKRWRYIRQTYSHYTRSNLPEYYLSPYVDFVKPYIKLPPCQNQNEPDSLETPIEMEKVDTETNLELQFLELIEGTGEKDNSTKKDETIIHVQDVIAVSSSTDSKRKRDTDDKNDPQSAAKLSKKDSEQMCVKTNWMFLESTLTFVDEMSKKQILRFRRKAMMLLNDILLNEKNQ